MSLRPLYLLGFAVIVGILASSFYLQFVIGVIPCALCTMQRLTFLLLGCWFVLGFLVYKHKTLLLITNCLCVLTSALGLSFAGRHVWLQHSPHVATDQCDAGLEYLLQVLPLDEAIKKIFAGSAECSQRGWEFLKLNIPEWALIWFVIFLGMSIYLMLKRSE